jgi:hypothetical protein
MTEEPERHRRGWMYGWQSTMVTGIATMPSE